MKYGELFAGYGGIGLALESIWPDARPAWFVEFDQAPSRILAHHWPDVMNHGDITTVDWAAVEPVDILTGGFPCQDLSHAGKRLGLRPGTRSGLWEHMAYAIDQLRPRMVVIENVRGLLSASAHSDMERDCWCVGDDREPALRALGAVLGDLADLGYDAEWTGVRAADAGAPHGRFRVFVVATPANPRGSGGHETVEHDGSRPPGGNRAGVPHEPGGVADGPGSDRGLVGVGPQPPQPVNGRGQADALPGVAALLPTPTVGDSKAARNSTATRHRIPPTGVHAGDTLTDITRKPEQFGPYAPAIARWEAVTGVPAPAPTEAHPKTGRHRLSPAFVEWMMGLPPGHVTGVPGLTYGATLKMLGNGVVPAQASLALSLLLGLPTPSAILPTPSAILPTPSTNNAKESGHCRDWGGDLTHALTCDCGRLPAHSRRQRHG